MARRLLLGCYEIHSELKTPFPTRDIDLLFVASSWTRSVKNYALVRKIAARCDGKLHIVGKVDQPHPRAHYHGVIAQRDELYALLGRSKTLVCPSLLDAAPGVSFEASAMECNVIASRNCGNWQLCNPQLLPNECTRDAFVGKIARSLAKRYADNRELFRGGYEDLVETLSVF